ncbi:MAG: hypothetical protein GC192_06315 [Bacteroidetes bacterium]|nr:hypothetical protein [Bacteroidota bacterium]
MRDTTDAKINMLRTVAKLYTDYKARFDVIPAIMTIFVAFNAKMVLLEASLAIAISDPTTAAKIALEKKNALANAAQTVALKVYAYAFGINDIDLMEVMKVRVSYLEDDKKDRLPTTCRTIHTRATAVKTEALPYGLTQAELDALDTAIIAYIAIADTPRIEHGKVNTSNDLTVKHIKELDAILINQLDRLVATLQSTDAELVSLWKTARKLVNQPTKKTQLFLTVLNPEDAGVEATKCVLNGKKKYTAYTDEFGTYHFQPTPVGRVLLEINADGFKPYSQLITLVRSQENYFEAVLELAA